MGNNSLYLRIDCKDLSKALFVSVCGYKMVIKTLSFLWQRKEYQRLLHEFQYSNELAPKNADEVE